MGFPASLVPTNSPGGQVSDCVMTRTHMLVVTMTISIQRISMVTVLYWNKLITKYPLVYVGVGSTLNRLSLGVGCQQGGTTP